jgi:hypothetical protein
MNTAQDMTAVARRLDGVTLIFQRYDDLWMIDRVSEPANERGDEDCYDVPDGLLAHEGCDGGCEACERFDGGTAVTRAELSGLSELERRRYHARQLRKLGLPERGHGSRLLWSMISDFERFAP